MKKYALTFVLTLLFLAGCKEDNQSQQELERERERARQAEIAREQAEKSKNMWQTVAWVAGVGAVVLLVFGTAIGSSARKDSENKLPEK